MRKLAFIPLTICLFLNWLFAMLANILEAISNAFEELCISLQKFTTPDAETKPAGEAKPAATSKGN